MAVDIRLPAFLRLDPLIGWKLSSVSEWVGLNSTSGNLELDYVGPRKSPLTDGSGAFAGLTLPTGVATGPAGMILVANPATGEILQNPHPSLFGDDSSEAPGFAPLWTAPEPDVAADDDCIGDPGRKVHGPYDLMEPRGLAFSRDGDLLVTDVGDETAASRLIVYTWPELRVRKVLELDGTPWDVAVDSRGMIYIADAGTNRIRRLDRAWRDTHWSGGQDKLNRPRHLAIDKDDTVYVIDLDPEIIQNRLMVLDTLGGARALTNSELAGFSALELAPPIQEFDGKYYAPGEPCVEHGQRLRNVVLDRRGRLPQGPVLRYVMQQGRRRRNGTYVSEALDSETYAFAWHRLQLDMELGKSQALEVQSYSDAHFLEPERIDRLPEQSWSSRIVLIPGDRPEVLVQSPPARFLWLRLRLVGDGLTSPIIRSIDILGPRKSSLRFLPAPFHQDPLGRDFLDRFLSYFDTVFAEIDQGVSQFSARLCPQGAPEGAYLSWLSSWFDIRFLAAWSDTKRRAFLANAMALHRARGTVPGLTALLRLHLDIAAPMPVVIEGFRLRNYSERRSAIASDLPEGSPRIGGRPVNDSGDVGQAHRFAVVVPTAKLPDAAARQSLIDLVDQFKPAHTAWTLIDIEPGVRVGCQSTVGVDTLLGSYMRQPLGLAQLGQSAQLSGPANRLPRLDQSRLTTRQ